MASDVTINTAINQQQKTLNSSSALAGDFDQFLQLLTVQLQNQDPLSPMETSEFTNQLVMFSGVEQQINMNQKLDSLVQLTLGNTFSTALGYVGLDASYLSSEAYFDGSAPVTIDYTVDGDAADTTINIFDERGDLVLSQKVSDDETVENFVWDGTTDGGGTAPEGTYTIRVDALDAQQNALDTSTVVDGRIHGIETQNGQIFVLVGERAVPVGSLINVSEPDAPQTTQPPANTGA